MAAYWPAARLRSGRYCRLDFFKERLTPPGARACVGYLQQRSCADNGVPRWSLGTRNFCGIHGSLRVTPAMEAGVAESRLELGRGDCIVTIKIMKWILSILLISGLSLTANTALRWDDLTPQELASDFKQFAAAANGTPAELFIGNHVQHYGDRSEQRSFDNLVTILSRMPSDRFSGLIGIAVTLLSGIGLCLELNRTNHHS